MRLDGEADLRLATALTLPGDKAIGSVEMASLLENQEY